VHTPARTFKLQLALEASLCDTAGARSPKMRRLRS